MLGRVRRLARRAPLGGTTEGLVSFAVPAGMDSAPPVDVLTLGAHSYGGPSVAWFLGDVHRVVVGRYCSFGPDVTIFVGGEHRIDFVTTYPVRERWGDEGAFRSGLPHSRGDVDIGNDVYVGAGATILSGVTVGDGAVIGARAVVARDVPAYSVWVGNPARQVRWRFPKPERDSLARIRWWDWPDELVRSSASVLCSADVAEFCRRHDEAYDSGDGRPSEATDLR